MGPTNAADVVVGSYQLLNDAEQEEAFEKISRSRLIKQAGEESETARYLRSLLRVQEHLGQPPNATTYRVAWRELREEGEEVESLHAVIKHFGSWRLAREAIELSQSDSADRIKARFERRSLDKVWKYTEATLKETLERCVADLGGVPQLAEFEHWREREIELARAEGQVLHLPSDGPYRRRYGSWPKALLGLGFTPDEVAERLERR